MTDNDTSFDLAALGLGKPTEYPSRYTPELLQAVPRILNRQSLDVGDEWPFFGADIWHGYELSWLNDKGKPVVALLRCTVPCTTPNIVESKSFKLYLNSFNQSRFACHDIVLNKLISDLSATAGGPVSVEMFEPTELNQFAPTPLPGVCIDRLDVEIDQYELANSLLDADMGGRDQKRGIVEETLHSHLLKSNCLITNQPDWASIVIEYSGEPICHQALLKYLISFRLHNEFHEQCVERIFMDLMRAYRLDKLTVQALYTRRGGLDINPLRSTEDNTGNRGWRSNRQ